MWTKAGSGSTGTDGRESASETDTHPAVSDTIPHDHARMAEHPDPVPGELLRLWRQSHHLSAERVARAVGVSRRRVRQWEDGVPTARAAQRYMDAITRLGSSR